MTQVLIRDLEPEVIEKLKNRAKRHSRSLQKELKVILQEAAKLDMLSARQVAERIRKKLSGRQFTDSTKLIREDRNR
ncbi:MAG: hypothetical protein IID16_10925 [Candidatus Marinimicrobia bacterium]|nr:hypothetical protein [Candidatus Neomarinimicrobiota bacterium]